MMNGVMPGRNWIWKLQGRLPKHHVRGQPPFFSWGFSEVTRLTWGRLYVSPRGVMWETGAPDHHLDVLLEGHGNKENKQSGLRWLER